MTHSEQVNEIAAALAKAQGQMKIAVKDSINPHFKSRYADLAAVLDAVRGPLSANGIAIVQGVEADETAATVTTLLAHTSGQWVRSSLRLPAPQANAQGFGSAVTYARRYLLSAMAGIAQDDDDGNAAVEHEPRASGVAGVKQALAREPDQDVMALRLTKLMGEAMTVKELPEKEAREWVRTFKAPGEKVWTEKHIEQITAALALARSKNAEVKS